MFRPQQPYESTLRERCKEFPKSAVSLIEKFLAVEPYKRGTASSALKSEVFHWTDIHWSEFYWCLSFRFLFSTSLQSHTRVTPRACQSIRPTKRWMLKPVKTKEGWSSSNIISVSGFWSSLIMLCHLYQIGRRLELQLDKKQVQESQGDSVSLCKNRAIYVKWFLLRRSMPTYVGPTVAMPTCTEEEEASKLGRR